MTEADGRPVLRLWRWFDPPVIGVAALALAAGFGQFGAVATLGDVAKSFGRASEGTTVAEQAGLSGSALGVGLAILRLASVASLPIAALADRFGRRTILLRTCGIGLALTVVAVASPDYWWFIAIFAFGRPLLSATTAVAHVNAAEHTSVEERSKAIALIAASYGVGAGMTAIVHALTGETQFRLVYGLAVVPLALLPIISRWVTEPDRFVRAGTSAEHSLPVLGAIAPEHRGRLLTVAVITVAVSIVTGPANSFLFVYAENVLGLSGAVVAAMVIGSGGSGLVGLLVGRWLADRWGRRPTAALALAALSVCGMLAYSGSQVALVIGYLLGVLAGSTFAPAAGALVNELFPTSVRASVAGWLVAAGVLGAVAGLVTFGAVADIGNRFTLAAVLTFTPAVLACALFRFLPETRGREPEDLWPTSARL